MDNTRFPDDDDTRPDDRPGSAAPLVRKQAYEIIEAVLAGTDPEGAEVRERLREHVAAHPGNPEAALHEHLVFTRSLARQANNRQANNRPNPNRQDVPRPAAGEQISVPGRGQAAIEAILHGGMLVTAFQPVHDLGRGGVIGAEALTRFLWEEDGSGAGSWFKNAAAVGLGADLEFSALQAAVAAAQDLPHHLVVALNLSPAVCLDPRLPGFLERAPLGPSRIMLELTEPLQSGQLGPLLDVLTPLRNSGMGLAVDEAGTDAASMRHIRSLRPDLIKIGRGLVAGIDADPSRQYLVADLVEFGRQTGAALAAVGIETAAELAVLTRLAVAAGQGHFLGRPTIDVKEWATWARPATAVQNRHGRHTAGWPQQPDGH
ncbi:EAL domain-containing protein (putative c-di-GMP-specific phosphodiesterase class I) [Arthrobacter globiformis]|uniref:EAL domain-containing protein n=1 Tax=Arthrobacter globiformis TaxID=1665 RepID=UPI00278672FE|nr:EAL domain-containing protein [Arthrobacter globiformis]MDQ1059945.1 EAL domain-containing protein (putative c-di-GMP-specific phosphodiesterase class I) [Arthrobacter globiformis]